MRSGGASGAEAPQFLFSVDVEDARLQLAAGDRCPSRVPAMTELYLDFLGKDGAKGTFFIVGDVARACPDLVRCIVGEGHEVGCHSDVHLPLHRLGPQAFRADTSRSLEALARAGADDVRGYRAPFFSLTEKTSWAYAILAELGFSYSSSVLPARNPIHGWPGFGHAPRMFEGVVELPMTLMWDRLLPLPTGGVYFRALPATLVRLALRARCRSGKPVLGYFHPYDLDREQEHFALPGFSRFGPYNWLMHRNRGSLLARLDSARRMGFAFVPYRDHADRVRAQRAKGA